jgi:stearoyl-CoA desaturase (delta-9 desaturase)
VGHWIGYRNGETKDHSRNIVPWGIVIGGEELHNNHHLDPASARLSKNWYEFDIGWMWLSLFRTLGFAWLRRN